MNNARQAVTRLTLDMSLPDVQRSFTVTHGDTNRRLEVTLNNGGQPFSLPKQWTAVLTGTLPGGDELYETCVVEDGRIIFDFAGSRTVSSEVGSFRVSFDVYDFTGEIVASPKVWINVLAGTRRLESPEALEKLTGLQNFLEKANSIEEELGEHGEKLEEHGEKLEEHGEKIEEHGEELHGHEEDISLLKSKIIQAGTFDVSKEEWTDDFPMLAFVPIENMGKGKFCLISPADSPTQVEAKKTMLSVQADTSGKYVILERASTGIAPDKKMSFIYLLLAVDNEEQKPRAALIGVDAHGAGTEVEASIEEQVKKIRELEKLKTRRTKVVIDEARWAKSDVYYTSFTVQGVENGDVVFVVPSDDQTREYAVLTGMRAETEVMFVSEGINLVNLERDLDTEDHNFDLNFTCFVLKAPDESEGAIAVLVGASQGMNAENTGGSSAPGGSEDEQNYDGSFVVEWNDSTRFGIGNTNKDYYTAGTKIDVYPADEKTYRTASAVGLYIYSFTDQAQNDAIIFALNDDAEIPEEALTFNFRVTKTGTSDNPTATLHLVWGGSGSGSGGGNIEQGVIDAIEERLGNAEDAIEENKNTLDTVIGIDTGKTMRAVAALVIAEALAEAPESLNSLEEIAAWIEAHPEDVAAIVERIVSLESAILTKLGTNDIVDALTSNSALKPLSANQGRVLLTMVSANADAIQKKQSAEQVSAAIAEAVKNLAKASDVPTLVSQLTNDKGYLTSNTGDQRYAKPSDIPAVPSTLPNPYALTILGKRYTGASAVTLTIDELVTAIKEAAGGVVAYVGENNDLVLSGNLPDGTYTAYYEVGGKLTKIGDLELGYIAPTYYTIEWRNYDGTVLETESVQAGVTPIYKGATPTRPADSQYTYTFRGWTPTVVAATADATYTAGYDKTAIAADPTNFFDVSSGKAGRLSSGGADRTDSSTTYISNYIEVKSGDVVVVKGCNTAAIMSGTDTHYTSCYNSSKTHIASTRNKVSIDYFTYNSVTSTETQLTITGSDVAYLRFTLANPNGASVQVDTSAIVINIKRNGAWL